MVFLPECRLAEWPNGRITEPTAWRIFSIVTGPSYVSRMTNVHTCITANLVKAKDLPHDP